MGHREHPFHHWACPGFTQDECLLCHITKIYGPFIFTKGTVTGMTYLDMLQQWLILQLDDDSNDYLFQQAGVPPHYCNGVRKNARSLAVLLPMTWNFTFGHPGHLTLPRDFFCGGMWRTLCTCHPCHKICQTYDSVLLLPSKPYTWTCWTTYGKNSIITWTYAAWHMVPTLNLCDVSKTLRVFLSIDALHVLLP
jgi:hypothetical protein